MIGLCRSGHQQGVGNPLARLVHWFDDVRAGLLCDAEINRRLDLKAIARYGDQWPFPRDLSPEAQLLVAVNQLADARRENERLRARVAELERGGGAAQPVAASNER